MRIPSAVFLTPEEKKEKEPHPDQDSVVPRSSAWSQARA
jgi:hypothetical protein